MEVMIRRIVQVRRVHGQSVRDPNEPYWLSERPDEHPAPADATVGRCAKIRDDFTELLALCNAHQVDYVIVGGYAMIFHGASGTTSDIDLLVRRTRDNAERILAALEEVGFASFDLRQADFILPANVVRLGVPPVCFDILTSLTGLSWERVDAGKVAGRYGDTTVFFVGRDDLIANMKALGREADAADLEALGAT